jgi:hypothetical protein
VAAGTYSQVREEEQVRLRTVLISAVVVILLALAIGIYVILHQFGNRVPLDIGRACEVRTPAGSVALDPTQMANAATIAAVGIRSELPDQAIVVALAVALQESKLENLDAGDRDSVGLFQQRPSQGWGTTEQIQDPRYAAGSFYKALVKVKGWQTMRVTEAAQKVQRSAFPEAYQKWADESAVLVEALAGRATSAVSCAKVGEPIQRGRVAADALDAGLRLDWGNVAAVEDSEAVGLVVAVADARVGWQYAHWLVAHSTEKSVERVRFGTQEWTASSGGWRQVNATDTSVRVVADVYPL